MDRACDDWHNPMFRQPARFVCFGGGFRKEATSKAKQRETVFIYLRPRAPHNETVTVVRFLDTPTTLMRIRSTSSSFSFPLWIVVTLRPTHETVEPFLRSLRQRLESIEHIEDVFVRVFQFTRFRRNPTNRCQSPSDDIHATLRRHSSPQHSETSYCTCRMCFSPRSSSVATRSFSLRSPLCSARRSSSALFRYRPSRTLHSPNISCSTSYSFNGLTTRSSSKLT